MATFAVDKHILVPKHSKISEKEKKDLIEKYSMTLAELPKIIRSDAALKKIAVKPGDVVKVERESQTASEVDFYRVVVDG